MKIFGFTIGKKKNTESKDFLHMLADRLTNSIDENGVIPDEAYWEITDLYFDRLCGGPAELPKEVQQLPLEYNEEDLFLNDRIHPLFVQTARVIAEYQKCNYTFLQAKLGLPRERVNEIIPQLIKYGIITAIPKPTKADKKFVYWKVLIRNEVQLDELIEHFKNLPKRNV